MPPAAGVPPGAFPQAGVPPAGVAAAGPPGGAAAAAAAGAAAPKKITKIKLKLKEAEARVGSLECSGSLCLQHVVSGQPAGCVTACRPLKQGPNIHTHHDFIPAVCGETKGCKPGAPGNVASHASGGLTAPCCGEPAWACKDLALPAHTMRVFCGSKCVARIRGLSDARAAEPRSVSCGVRFVQPAPGSVSATPCPDPRRRLGPHPLPSPTAAGR